MKISRGKQRTAVNQRQWPCQARALWSPRGRTSAWSRARPSTTTSEGCKVLFYESTNLLPWKQNVVSLSHQPLKLSLDSVPFYLATSEQRDQPCCLQQCAHHSGGCWSSPEKTFLCAPSFDSLVKEKFPCVFTIAKQISMLFPSQVSPCCRLLTCTESILQLCLTLSSKPFPQVWFFAFCFLAFFGCVVVIYLLTLTSINRNSQNVKGQSYNFCNCLS